ncbi:hypothetical protein CVT24_009963 [Panaeolus cyanescens]|uniref:Nephrocystin 3-like N-terminal domain-containing protein n=1 Tax=Panaeolus cyanescens TaxID=181874 RepID=A0A409VXD8_9AGAR|nr:hypothetical protein CVT24_009963 [Panaeolus cyanescens]
MDNSAIPATAGLHPVLTLWHVGIGEVPRALRIRSWVHANYPQLEEGKNERQIGGSKMLWTDKLASTVRHGRVGKWSTVLITGPIRFTVLPTPTSTTLCAPSILDGVGQVSRGVSAWWKRGLAERLDMRLSRFPGPTMADPSPPSDGSVQAQAVLPPMLAQSPNKVVITGDVVTNFVQNSSSAADRAFERLHMHICLAAYENSDDYDEMKCYPGTRKVLLERLESWAVVPANERRPMTWLDGPMGSGKTAIARSMADRFSHKRKLLGMFIFRRGRPKRNNASLFITTLAYQMALSIPLTRPYIEQQIIRDPSIFEQSLSCQLDALVITPLQSIRMQNPHLDDKTLPNVLIVDGLDECESNVQEERKKEGQIAVLGLLHRLAEKTDLLPFAIFVHSRPERQISNWFTMEQHENITSRITLKSSYDSYEDIEFFVKQSFLKILTEHPSRDSLSRIWPLDTLDPDLCSHQHPNKPWPVVAVIVQKSSGHFLYPSILMRYIASPHHEPNKRLEDILSSPNGSPNSSDSPNAILDTLFHQILDAAGDHTKTMQLLLFNSISSVPDRLNPTDEYPTLECQQRCYILKLLRISKQEFKTWLQHMAPLLKKGRIFNYIYSTPFLVFHHSSFGEFLSDQGRAKNWAISDPLNFQRFIARIASRALKLFGKTSVRIKQISYLNTFRRLYSKYLGVNGTLHPPFDDFESLGRRMILLCDFPNSCYHRSATNLLKLSYTGDPLLSCLDIIGKQKEKILSWLRLSPLWDEAVKVLNHNFIDRAICSLIKPQLEFYLSDPIYFAIFLQWVHTDVPEIER